MIPPPSPLPCTGFKWLGNEALRLEAGGYTVLFAFEEAIGYMMGQAQHDKDGISAAAVFAELAGAGAWLAACLPFSACCNVACPLAPAWQSH